MATTQASQAPPPKTHFVRAYLDDNPRAGFRAVNQAWTEAGYEGSISETLVHRTRAEKGLSGNLRAGRSGGSNAKARRGASGSTPRARRDQPRASVSTADAGPGSSPTTDDSLREAPVARAVARPSRAIAPAESLEAEFDRLLFRIMDRGMPEVEEAIRTARRLFVLRQGR